MQDHARTMLIHANKRWPAAINTHLWPYALRMANDIMNATPNLKTGKVPLNIFAGTNIASNPKHWYPLGCPVYVLDSEMQTGKKLSKWANRARVGIYLGHSPQHARTVALVLSMTTGLVSPQFHVRMDPTFQTLRSILGGSSPKSHWQLKCHFAPSDKSDGSGNPPVDAVEKQASVREGASQSASDAATEPTVLQENLPFQRSRINQVERLMPSSTRVGPSEGASETQVAEEEPQQLQQLQQQHETEASPLSDDRQPPQIGTSQPTSRDIPDTSAAGSRQSNRPRKPRQRLIEMFEAELAIGNRNDPYFVAYESVALGDIDDGFLAGVHPLLAYAASADPDTMYYHEAMQQPDRKQFVQAMSDEVRSQTNNGNWTICKASDVPKGSTILPAVWAMKRKRRIATREVYKWKARLNIDGSKQIKGLNYWETYAPVASWPTIRLILIMSIVQGWYTRQIDYVLAYTQADAETDNLYMKVPKGFEIPGDDPNNPYVLKIRKNIYGQKQAGRVWNKHLVRKLKSVGFKQSAIDECVFYRGKSIYVLYTDDSILAGPDNEELDQIIKDMQEAKLDLTVDGDICDFLGVRIEKTPDGTIHLTQPHLIDQILKDLRLTKENVVPKHTPALVNTILRRFTDSEPFDGHFNYRSVVGKLNYLEKSTRPDISYAVHQCARFAADPKIEHGKAVLWLGRYLAATKDQGIIFKPTLQSFDCYVDADFSGNWNRDEATGDPDTARSRSGYVIQYAGCPIVWASKLQTQVALSTTEAEYIALSTALRDTIPLMELVKELRENGFDYTATQPTIHCKVFEDNSGALEIATVHKFRPRTKHINTQYHHFRQYVENGKITIIAISTEDQCADILTKSLSVPIFTKHRRAIMGW